MGVIEDGTGKGFTAKVDNFNRVRTFSTNTTQEHHAATIGEAFSFTTSFLSLPNGFTGPLMYFQNTNPTRLMDIQAIELSGDTADIQWEFRKNDTVGTLSNETQLTVVNTNFGSGKVAQAVAYEWDEVGSTGIGGLTAGTVYKRIQAGEGGTPIQPIGATILGANDVWTLVATNATGGAANVAAYVRVFFEGTD